MVKTYIVYGYSFTLDDVENIFEAEKYPDFYEIDSDSLLKDELELGCLVYGALDKIVKKFNKVHNPSNIFLYQTDFEFDTTEVVPNDNTKSTFILKDKGQTTFILGIKLCIMNSHYSGVVAVPNVNLSTKAVLEKFVKGSVSIDLDFIDPVLLTVTDSEK